MKAEEKFGRSSRGDKPIKHGSRDEFSMQEPAKSKPAARPDAWERNVTTWTTQEMWDSPTPWEPESAAKAEERSSKDKREEERPSKRKKEEERRDSRRRDERSRRGDGRRPTSNREYVRGGRGTYPQGGGRVSVSRGRGWQPNRSTGSKDFEWGPYQHDPVSSISMQSGNKNYTRHTHQEDDLRNDNHNEQRNVNNDEGVAVFVDQENGNHSVIDGEKDQLDNQKAYNKDHSGRGCWHPGERLKKNLLLFQGILNQEKINITNMFYLLCR